LIYAKMVTKLGDLTVGSSGIRILNAKNWILKISLFYLALKEKRSLFFMFVTYVDKKVNNRQIFYN
jgi:hypothetical protein